MLDLCGNCWYFDYQINYYTSYYWVETAVMLDEFERIFHSIYKLLKHITCVHKIEIHL